MLALTNLTRTNIQSFSVSYKRIANSRKEEKRMKKDTKFEVFLSVIPINSVFSLSSRVHDMTRMI